MDSVTDMNGITTVALDVRKKLEYLIGSYWKDILIWQIFLEPGRFNEDLKKDDTVGYAIVDKWTVQATFTDSDKRHWYKSDYDRLAYFFCSISNKNIIYKITRQINKKYVTIEIKHDDDLLVADLSKSDDVTFLTKMNLIKLYDFFRDEDGFNALKPKYKDLHMFSSNCTHMVGTIMEDFSDDEETVIGNKRKRREVKTKNYCNMCSSCYDEGHLIREGSKGVWISPTSIAYFADNKFWHENEYKLFVFNRAIRPLKCDYDERFCGINEKEFEEYKELCERKTGGWNKVNDESQIVKLSDVTFNYCDNKGKEHTVVLNKCGENKDEPFISKNTKEYLVKLPDDVDFVELPIIKLPLFDKY
ncbi:MAG: hypothetical protein Terrestrivirus1_170 [Terrestrivirus sp.]|uniref:Uncharacterized protein n=1 Tax=Terrestrivirus sp. TaxID=2487775 RepID=A0A3G4ZKD8_9VIRU|nr:MAG: hypothetical protein Terrestrivirus1_170 [Terrestrivirus sp.]